MGKGVGVIVDVGGVVDVGDGAEVEGHAGGAEGARGDGKVDGAVCTIVGSGAKGEGMVGTSCGPGTA